MFRRKEENATDSLIPASGNGSEAGSTAASAAPLTSGMPPAAASGASSSSASGSSASPASAPHSSTPAGSYAPTATSAAPAAASTRTPSEPVARVASPATGSYRPTPIADFTRSTGRAAESARPTAAASASGFSAAASEKTGTKANRRVLTVGNDILLKGEIATCDRLVIEGRVEAKLSEVHTVEIAECGSFKGTAEVEDAEISGVFEGDLVVRNRLVIYATGEVRGNIGYGEIEIERGGRLTGQIKTASAAAGKGKPMEADKSVRKEATAA